MAQIRIIKRNGRNVAFYRAQLVSGGWGRHWFRITVPEARRALRVGHHDFGGMLGRLNVVEG